MSELDVSELLTDPDLAGNCFTVYRRQQTVNSYGETSLTTTTLQGIGAIYPTGENRLQRQADFSTQANTITVVTQFRLRGASKDADSTFQPDIVGWQGGNYVVSNVNEFTQYGAGFIEAECTSIDFTPPAPV